MTPAVRVGRRDDGSRWGIHTAWLILAFAAAAIGRSMPSLVRQHLKPVTYLAIIESALLLVESLVIAPLLLAAASAWSRRLAGSDAGSLRRTFVTFAYMLVPVGLGVHLAHNLGHLLLLPSSCSRSRWRPAM